MNATIKTSEISNFQLITEAQKLEIIKAHKEEQKEKAALKKAQRSELTINRLEINKSIKKELLNFENVHYLYIKQNFSFLTSRPTVQKVTENLEKVTAELFTHCSDAIAKKVVEENVTFYFDRLPRLLTDKNLLVAFMTQKQFENIENKCFQGTNIIDLLIKGLTCKVQLYESAIIRRKKITLPKSDTKIVLNK